MLWDIALVIAIIIGSFAAALLVFMLLIFIGCLMDNHNARVKIKLEALRRKLEREHDQEIRQ